MIETAIACTFFVFACVITAGFIYDVRHPESNNDWMYDDLGY